MGFLTCRPAVFRAVKVGPCAAAVKPTDLPERITAVSVRGVYAAWTTTVPGEENPTIHPSALLPPLLPLRLAFHHSSPFFLKSSSASSHLFRILCVFRINNCVGELNQKYFIQFLFYTGEYVQQTSHSSCIVSYRRCTFWTLLGSFTLTSTAKTLTALALAVLQPLLYNIKGAAWRYGSRSVSLQTLIPL